MGKLFKSVLFGLPLVILGACSADEPLGNDNGKESPVADKTEIRYLKVNLVNATGGNGRAIGDNASTDYADGTEAENKIRTVDFYLYTADRQYHSHVPLSLTAAEDPKKSTGLPDHVHGFYEANVPINLMQGEMMPQYVICIVNAVNASFYENRPMAEAQNRLLTSFYSPLEGGNKYLGMNNSVYYGRDEVKGTENELIMATPFDTNKLLTQTELDKMTNEQKEAVTIDIYVERYAAKVNFNITDNAVKDYEAADPTDETTPIILSFAPKGWGLNAYERQFFFLKSFRTSGEIESDYASFDTMNGLLFNGWNRPDHFRSFWARTPGYYDNDYPLVADDITDVATYPYDAEGSNYPYSVYYQSFSSAINAVNGFQYTMETTLKGTRLTGADMPEQYLPLTSIPSVVLVGQYKINNEAKSFYTYQKDKNDKPYIFAANAGELGAIPTIHDRLLLTQTIVLQKTETGYAPVTTDDSRAFVVEHPKQDARHGLKVGGDLVTLQVKGTNSGYWYYDSEIQNYTQISTPNDVNKVNRLLYQNLGGAHAYVNGMAFFSAPIQHWGWYRDGNDNYGKSMADWDWSLMKTGDFGIVRNHVYTIQIDNIAGLGTGIIRDTDPLLPPTDKVSYAVKFRVNIQKWATLPAQKWEW